MIKNRAISGEAIRSVMGSPRESEGQGGTRWHGVCSTKYVRGREAIEARVIGQLEFVFIANCNQSFNLQEV